MKKKLVKLGGSLALVLPKPFIRNVKTVDMIINEEERKIIVKY